MLHHSSVSTVNITRKNTEQTVKTINNAVCVISVFRTPLQKQDEPRRPTTDNFSRVIFAVRIDRLHLGAVTDLT